MVEYGQIAANWGQLIEDNINIIVPVSHYSMKDDPRFLIPFQKGDKLGMLNKDGEIVVDAKYDHISSDGKWIKVGVRYSYGYCRKNNSVQTYDSIKWGIVDANGNVVLNSLYGQIVICDNSFIVREAYGSGNQRAVIDLCGNIIVPFGTYSDIEPFVNGFARCRVFTIKDNKRIELCGVIDEQGNVILECNERRISPFYGRYKYKGLTILKDILLRENPTILNKYFAVHSQYDSTNTNVQEDDNKSHYGEFAGSYAQDVAGYSDDVINDAFEGDPDNYWNID